jgi:predicted AAA+ superfamily ATPase
MLISMTYSDNQSAGGVLAMERTAIEKLIEWRSSKRRKLLIIRGARQVGKTWLMKEFGRREFKDTVYVNFDSNTRMEELFSA